MNPDKLFDYLDGKLSPADRGEVEAKLAKDPQLQRQLAVAREIHRGMTGTRESHEVYPPIEDPAIVERGGRIGRRIATAAIALVLLNVLVGLAVITVKNKKPAKANPNELAIRQQLAASLNAAAQNALPAPTFVAAEIELTAPKTDWDGVATKVVAAAETCGGSAAKGLPDEAALMVVADVPSAREAEFRQLVSASPAPPSAAAVEEPAGAPEKRTIVQVRIKEAAR